MSSGCVAITSQTVVAVTFTGQGLSASVGSEKLDAGAVAAGIVSVWMPCNASARFVELDKLPAISSANKTTTTVTLINPDLLFITSLPLLVLLMLSFGIKPHGVSNLIDVFPSDTLPAANFYHQGPIINISFHEAVPN